MNIDKDKQDLIGLIKWYRDEYHRKDFGHTEMIKKIEETSDPEVLEIYYQITDGWLDY